MWSGVRGRPSCKQEGELQVLTNLIGETAANILAGAGGVLVALAIIYVLSRGGKD